MAVELASGEEWVVPVDRETIRAYTGYSWAEVIRHARTELVRNSPLANQAERAMLGLPVHMSWREPDGSSGGALGVLVAIENDMRARWAVVDDGFGYDTQAEDFTMRACTVEELEELRS
jgi:hypothetical protein